MKKNNRILFFFVLLLFTNNLSALNQSDSLSKKEHTFFDGGGFGGSFTLGFERKACIGFGICIMGLKEVSGMKGGGFKLNYFTSTASLNIDTKFGQNQFYLAPRITFEQTVFTIFMIKTDLSYNTDFQNYDLRFTPNFGLTFMGLASICYGYNIPVSGLEFQDISRHRISISISLANIFDHL